MKFKNYDQLESNLSKWLGKIEIESVWHWLQQGMITEDKITEITEKCCCDEECIENSLKNNAWQNFIAEYITK